MLTVINYAGTDKHRSSLWNCLCDCGNNTIVRSNAFNKTKSCGCYNIIHKKSCRGNKHACWDPTKTEEEREFGRFVQGYKEWLFDIKKLFNFTCFICKDNRGGNLVSHHIESYHANKELRMDLQNGVCLCDKCHKEFHKKYGLRNNTRIQFYEFLTIKNIKYEYLESNQNKN